MILSNVLNVLRGKQYASISETSQSKAAEKQVLTTLEIVSLQDELVHSLLSKYAEFKGSFSEETHAESATACTGKSNQYMYVNNDRSYILRNKEGQIVKTADVQNKVKEFKFDENTGKLLVKKFGVWTEPNHASLTENGTFIWRNSDAEMHECLDGTHIYISFVQKSLVAHNELTGEDISITSSHEVRHRYKKKDCDQVRIYRNWLLTNESIAFDSPVSCEARTMAELQHLKSVNKIERCFANGLIVSESYTFLEERTGTRALAMMLNLPSGELHLSKVSKLENIYRDGQLVESLYILSEPVTVSRDKEGNVSLIRGISKVRRLQIHDGVYEVVFIDSNGDENIYFPQI